MKTSPSAIKKDLQGLIGLLDRESLLSLTNEEQERLQEEAGELLDRLESLEGEFLTIGLLGGTGVGKSTLMNALAGADIASVSHRRPHTDHVLVYRHQEAPSLPEPPPETVPWQEITHHADEVRNILLCDLPDFDSLLTSHRQGVVDFLSHLDLLVWVTTPEKYGDARFHEMLRVVPKAETNFYFVLNKTDSLFNQDPTLQTLSALTETFRSHLAADGIDDPEIYIISALEVLENKRPSPWNQLPLLRQQVFKHRDMKQVRAIKSANLDIEASRLLSRLHNEAALLGKAQKTLEEAASDLEERRSDWIQAGKSALSTWLQGPSLTRFLIRQEEKLPLAGPALALALLFRAPRDQGPDISMLQPPEEVQDGLRRHLAWVEDRLGRRLHHQNLPSPIHDEVKQTLDPDRRFETLGERFFTATAARLTSGPLPGFRAFLGLQRLIYTLLLILLLTAVPGPSAWRGLIQDPGVASLADLVAASIHNLFSGKGLAALAAYAFLSIFFSIRFYLSFRRRLRTLSSKISLALQEDLLEIWQEQLDSVKKDLELLASQLSTRKKTLLKVADRS
ncbi:MAG: GTPase [Desulfobacteraceae bacterium]